MTGRLPVAIAVAFSLGIAGGASAQLLDGDDDAAASGSTMAGQLHSSGIPVGWEGEVANAFFEQGGELLPEEEIQANWRDLDEGHQTQVIRDCGIFTQVDEPADAAVIQRSAAEPAPKVDVSPGAERSGDAIEFEESRDFAVEITEEEEDLPGSRHQPGKEAADVTGHPHLARIRLLCSTLASM